MHAAALAFSWAVLCLGGFGLPLSVPPQPEVPLMAKIAPADCLFYMSLAGVATPKAGSDNLTEQLLAEPEVQKLVAELGRAVTSGLTGSLKERGAEMFLLGRHARPGQDAALPARSRLYLGRREAARGGGRPRRGDHPSGRR